MSDSLLDELIELETALHKQSIRNDRTRLEELLHGDFFEFGSSGKVWSRSETIEALTAEAQDADIKSTHYKLRRLADGVAQLTYTSKRADGSQALRSSLWKLDQGVWKMIFHQGTKTHF
jgi:hypothetical protein